MRPKVKRNPQTLHLNVEKSVKDALIGLAANAGLSVSAFVERMTIEAANSECVPPHSSTTLSTPSNVQAAVVKAASAVVRDVKAGSAKRRSGPLTR